MKNINYWTTVHQPTTEIGDFYSPSQQLSSNRDVAAVLVNIIFLPQIQYFLDICAVEIFEKHVDRKDLVGSDTKKQFHFISGNGAESRGIEMVITLLLSAIIVRTFLYILTFLHCAFSNVQIILHLHCRERPLSPEDFVPRL